MVMGYWLWVIEALVIGVWLLFLVIEFGYGKLGING